MLHYLDICWIWISAVSKGPVCKGIHKQNTAEMYDHPLRAWKGEMRHAKSATKSYMLVLTCHY